MPAYEYSCKGCSHKFMALLSIKEFKSNLKIKCPHCQSDSVQKIISESTAKTSKKSQISTQANREGNMQKRELARKTWTGT